MGTSGDEASDGSSGCSACLSRQLCNSEDATIGSTDAGSNAGRRVKMKANKFSGTGGLQHWLCASVTVVKPCPSSPPLSLLLVAPGRGSLPPENPTLGLRNLPLFYTKISQRKKAPSPFSLRSRALPCLRLHLNQARADRAGKGGTSADTWAAL